MRALLDGMERTVRHFGLAYDYDSGGVRPGEPLPAALDELRERIAALIEREPQDLVQVSGAARWSWQHSIPATKAFRYSVTFRTIRRGR